MEIYVVQRERVRVKGVEEDTLRGGFG